MLKFAAALLGPALALVAPVGGTIKPEASLSGPGGWVRPAN